jgi:hypothetical protein
MDEFKTVDRSLKTQSEKLEQANHAFSEAASGPVAQEGDSVYSFIEGLKTQLRSASEKITKNRDYEDFDAGNEIMIKHKMADTLFLKLNRFKKLCLEMVQEDSVRKIIHRSLDIDYLGKPMGNEFYSNIPTVAILTMMARFQNGIRVVQNTVLSTEFNRKPLNKNGINK